MLGDGLIFVSIIMAVVGIVWWVELFITAPHWPSTWHKLYLWTAATGVVFGIGYFL